MFGFGPQFNMHHQCMSNPFGATMLNPKINFCLGLAAATSGTPTFAPMFSPMMQTPMVGSLFATPVPMPMIGSFGYNSFGGLNNFGGYNNFGNFNFNFNLNPNPTPTYDFSNFFKGLGGNISGVGATYNAPFPSLSNFKFNFGTVQSNNNSEIDNFNPTGKKLALNSDAYGPKFLEKVKQIAQRLNCNYRDLLGLMNSESGINAAAKNPNGSASGLIQFIEATANSLGTTTAALRKMSPIDQLDYVEKCIANSKSAAGFSANAKLSAGDLYALIFLPARAKRDVLTVSGESYYNSNPGLDANKDGKITKAELGQRIKNKYVSDNSFLA